MASSIKLTEINGDAFLIFSTVFCSQENEEKLLTSNIDVKLFLLWVQEFLNDTAK